MIEIMEYHDYLNDYDHDYFLVNIEFFFSFVLASHLVLSLFCQQVKFCDSHTRCGVFSPGIYSFPTSELTDLREIHVPSGSGLSVFVSLALKDSTMRAQPAMALSFGEGAHECAGGICFQQVLVEVTGKELFLVGEILLLEDSL